MHNSFFSWIRALGWLNWSIWSQQQHFSSKITISTAHWRSFRRWIHLPFTASPPYLRAFPSILRIYFSPFPFLIFLFSFFISKEIINYERLKDVVSDKVNYKIMRSMLSQCQPPVVPYLGMYLSDLFFIEVRPFLFRLIWNNVKARSTDYVPEGLIRFSNRSLVANVILDIQQLQGERYPFVRVKEIQDYLLNCTMYDEDVHYQVILFRLFFFFSTLFVF